MEYPLGKENQVPSLLINYRKPQLNRWQWHTNNTIPQTTSGDINNSEAAATFTSSLQLLLYCYACVLLPHDARLQTWAQSISCRQTSVASSHGSGGGGKKILEAWVIEIRSTLLCGINTSVMSSPLHIESRLVSNHQQQGVWIPILRASGKRVRCLYN